MVGQSISVLLKECRISQSKHRWRRCRNKRYQQMHM